jgi:hypothetical protein
MHGNGPALNAEPVPTPAPAAEGAPTPPPADDAKSARGLKLYLPWSIK